MEGTLCSSSDACPASTPACDSAAFTRRSSSTTTARHCSVTGGYVYRGSASAQLRGAYVFGDFCSGVLWAAVRQGERLHGAHDPRTGPRSSPSFGEDRTASSTPRRSNGQLFRFAGEAAGGTRRDRRALRSADLEVPAQERQYRRGQGPASSASARAAAAGCRSPATGTATARRRWASTIRASSIFRLKNSSSGGGSDVILQVDSPSRNATPHRPATGTATARETVGLYDPATRTFRLKNSLSGSGFDLTFAFGPSASGLTPARGRLGRRRPRQRRPLRSGRLGLLSDQRLPGRGAGLPGPVRSRRAGIAAGRRGLERRRPGRPRRLRSGLGRLPAAQLALGGGSRRAVPVRSAAQGVETDRRGLVT